MSAPAPLLPVAAAQSTGLLATLLTMSLTAVALLRPVYAKDGQTITDFAWVYLNPAGQQMLGQPGQPTESLLTLFPGAHAHGHFATCRRAFETGEPGRLQNNYQADGIDGYFLVVAQRHDDLLLVNFTDTNEQPRSAAEQALRESQAAEQAALAEAERQRALLYRVFEQAPAMICILQGPEYVFEFANLPYRALMGDRPLLGRPFAEALPELAGQGIFEALDHLYRTGEPIYASERLAQLDHTNTSPAELEKRYYNFVWQARRDLAGAIDGVLVFAYDVTPQVLARQQVQALNEELAASNAALTATNAEYRRANEALQATQQQVRQLNAALEARVQERTHVAEQALAEAERQRRSLAELVQQAPAAMCVVAGPDFTYEAFNPLYAEMFGGRPQVSRPMGEVLPEVVNHPGFLALRAVYQEGRTTHENEVLVPLARPGDGVLEDHYFSYTQQPRYGSQGQIDGVFVFAVEVTEQVRARQQVEQLNQELEARVQQRTREALALQAELLAVAQQQAAEREAYYQVFAQTPAAIALLRGPDLCFEFVNPAFQQLFAGRTLLGLPYTAALPEGAAQGFAELLSQVYQTGEPYVGTELPFSASLAEGPAPGPNYYNVTYQAVREGGEIVGISTFAFDVTTQVLARREREAQQQLLVTVLEQAPVAFFVVQGPDYIMEVLNEMGARLLGRSREQLLGRPYFEAMPELVAQGFPALLDQVRHSGQPAHFTEVLIHLPGRPPGQEEYFNFVYQPLFDAQGQVARIACVAVEVSEQVRARQQVEQLNQELEMRVQARTQEALALQAELLAAAQRQVQARESFYQVFEQTPAAVSLLRGPSYRFDYVNPVYQQVFAGRQLVGRDFAEALPDATAQGYLALLEGVYHTGETFFGAEVPFVSEQPDAPARTTYFTFTYQAYRENGEIVGISTFALDVTEQVLARQEREAQRGELQRLFEQAPVAIAVFRGPQYIIELANAPLCAILDRTPAQALGTPLFELVPEAAGWGFEQQLDRVRATGEPFVAHERPSFVDRHGRRDTVYWDFVYAPLREADGTIERVTIVATEVTEQVRARQQVQDLNQALTTSNEELGESNRQLTRTNVDLDTFVYTASHDLKAPITNIEGLLAALRYELPAAVQAEEMTGQLLDMIQGAVERFQLTITQLTDVSRMQHAQNQPAEQVSLAAVVEDVRLDLGPLLTSTQAQFTAEVGPDVVVHFSPKNLRSVVVNLLSNALKYHRPGLPPVVQLRAVRQGQQVVLTVADNGLGLGEGQQRQLFGLFQRLHTHVEGTGVGLYMVKRMVENAGGTITVQSQLGQGTTFTVTFPA